LNVTPWCGGSGQASPNPSGGRLGAGGIIG